MSNWKASLFFVKVPPKGFGGPLALQQPARHFPHLGLGRHATNTRHLAHVSIYKEDGSGVPCRSEVKVVKIEVKKHLKSNYGRFQ